MNASRITTLRLLSQDASLTRKDAQGAIEELCDALQACQRRREKPKFSLSDVMTEAKRMNWPAGLAEQCSDTYERVGWMTGRNPIVSLPAAMRTWMRNHQKWNGAVNGPNGKEPPKGWDEFLKEKRYDESKFNYAPEWQRLEFATWKKNGAKENSLL